jgi:hypothetical protein
LSTVKKKKGRRIAEFLAFIPARPNFPAFIFKTFSHAGGQIISILFEFVCDVSVLQRTKRNVTVVIKHSIRIPYAERCAALLILIDKQFLF